MHVIRVLLYTHVCMEAPKPNTVIEVLKFNVLIWLLDNISKHCWPKYKQYIPSILDQTPSIRLLKEDPQPSYAHHSIDRRMMDDLLFYGPFKSIAVVTR